MAAAAGLHLVPKDRRDPRLTTTYGVGELIAHALDCGVARLIIGIGGSATNDGGAGMAQALGFALRDKDNHDVSRGGAALAKIRSIDPSRANAKLAHCEILIACDVDNPLCGPRGASHIFGPQKGADVQAVDELDAALLSFAKIIEKTLGVAIADRPGAGAAGGLGGGLVAFCGAKLVPGAQLIADTVGLAEKIAGADLVITGEGRIDGQTASGKTPAGVARIAKEKGVPCIALAGCVEPGYEALYNNGLTAAFPIAAGPGPLEEALKNTPERLAATTEAILRVWRR
jgi:glycerate kinase